MCQLAGAAETPEVRATSLATLTQMVANGLGVTLLPKLAVDVEIARDASLAAIPFAPPPPTRSIGLMWRRSSARGDEFRALGESIKAAVGRL